MWIIHIIFKYLYVSTYFQPCPQQSRQNNSQIQTPRSLSIMNQKPSSISMLYPSLISPSHTHTDMHTLAIQSILLLLLPISRRSRKCNVRPLSLSPTSRHTLSIYCGTARAEFRKSTLQRRYRTLARSLTHTCSRDNHVPSSLSLSPSREENPIRLDPEDMNINTLPERERERESSIYMYV